ncbi:hypothetical protein SNEBB_002613 [Seison nebaliae]|nr:hypothetical protein SNEBB_002613 [Seison nebaliae]
MKISKINELNIYPKEEESQISLSIKEEGNLPELIDTKKLFAQKDELKEQVITISQNVDEICTSQKRLWLNFWNEKKNEIPQFTLIGISFLSGPLIAYRSGVFGKLFYSTFLGGTATYFCFPDTMNNLKNLPNIQFPDREVLSENKWNYSTDGKFSKK